MAKSRIELLIDAKNKTGKAFDAANRNISKLEKNVKNIQRLGNVFSGLVVGAGIIASFRAVINATKEQEAVLAQVEQRLESTGGASGKTSEELTKLSASLQKVTTFGDEAILKMQSLLLTFTNIKGDTFNTTTEAILDMSVAMGQDLKTSALQLGKALNDPIKGITALTRVGVAFTDSQKEQIKTLTELGEIEKAQAIILKELQIEFGGAAKAAADTFGGALDQLGNAFGDLLEADNLSGAKQEIQSLTELLQDPATKQAFADITSLVISMTSSFAGGAVELVNFTKGIIDIIGGASGFGAAYDALQVKIDGLTEKIAENNNEIDSFFINPNRKKGLQDVNLELEKQIELLKQQQSAVFDSSVVVNDLGIEAASTKDALEEMGGVQIDNNDFSKSVDEIIEKLKEEAYVLTLSAKEQFIYNQIKKAGTDATYEEINAIKKAAESLFDQKEKIKAAKSETKKLSKATNDYKKSTDSISSSGASATAFGKAKKDVEGLTEETEKATKAKKKWLSTTGGEGVDTSDAFDPVNLTPEQAAAKALEITTAMQQTFDANPVQVKVNVPTAKKLLGDTISVNSSYSPLTEGGSGLSAVSVARTALKEGTKQ